VRPHGRLAAGGEHDDEGVDDMPPEAGSHARTVTPPPAGDLGREDEAPTARILLEDETESPPQPTPPPAAPPSVVDRPPNPLERTP
jgi:hypothetical protein